MGYAAWSVVAGETPTAAKWNILGSNDSSFNDGTGIAAAAIGTSAIATNAITADKLATSAITLGYAQITSSSTTTSTTPVAGSVPLGVTVTIPAGGRRIKITLSADSINNSVANDYVQVSIWDGTVGSGTELAIAGYQASLGSAAVPMTRVICVTPSAGSKTYNVGINALVGGTATLSAASTSPACILVEAI